MPSDAQVKHLSDQLNNNPIIATLLLQRGLYTFEAARDFFRPRLSQLYNPFLMQDMEKAIARIANAIERGEKILIYGDYDVDGTTAVALVYSYFKGFYSNLVYYVPDRYQEGYGISTAGVDYANQHGVTLMIALDCGIKEQNQIAYAATLGIDVIVCDHHEPSVLPPAWAILNPKRKDCNYPFKDLSGCGIGFKLIQAYAMYTQQPLEDIYSFLDLTAVSIAADIVSMTDENRILVKFGLEKMNTSPRSGIEWILQTAGIQKASDTTTYFKSLIDVNKLVFVVAPRINAAGRIKHGLQAVNILLGEDLDALESMASDLNDINTARKELDESIKNEALEIIHKNPEYATRKTTVVYHPQWHKGVVGIVASRLIEQYHKPTVVLTKSNGLLTGSARSIPGFDLYAAITKCSHLLDKYGGHTFAAGLSLKEENLNAFIEEFENVSAPFITEEMLVPQQEVDFKLSFNQLTLGLVKMIEQMAPFGPGNLAPVFVTENCFDLGYASIVGENHLRLFVKQEGTNEAFSAIGFGMGHLLPEIKHQKRFHLCYHAERNVYKGKESVQLKLKDVWF